MYFTNACQLYRAGETVLLLLSIVFVPHVQRLNVAVSVRDAPARKVKFCVKAFDSFWRLRCNGHQKECRALCVLFIPASPGRARCD